MDNYLGTKQIKAKPMDRGEYNAYRGWEVPVDENPLDEGYLVEYMDGGSSNHPDHEGYISWSPKGVFEKAYRANSTPQQRVQIEHDDLEIKLKGLTGFLEQENAKQIVGDMQFHLMVDQEVRMEEYLSFLKLRLEEFAK